MSTDLHVELRTEGLVRVEGALDPQFCDDVVARVLEREGVADDEPSRWPSARLHCPVVDNWALDDVAPRAAAAVDELVGGRERIRFAGVQDNLIINVPDPDAAWQPPSSIGDGWHKDGDWFRHFLDSPEQALLMIVFWRDVSERQGPTLVAVDSIGPVATLLADRPGGMVPKELRRETNRIIRGCRDIRSLTGSRGTIALAHPYLLHTASPNCTDRLRIISNSSVMLRTPLAFGHHDHSPLERSILDALGVDRLDFEVTGERGSVVSERERKWKARSAGAS